MSEFQVIHRENLQAFDRLTLNTSHRLEFDHGELSAVYPVDADKTEYVVAVFPVEGGTADVPDGSAVLTVDGDSVIALVPSSAYGAEGEE